MPYRSSSQESGSEQLYFAYGSNLHLRQMRRRCPDSRYIGTAKLYHHRFHINQRGYANLLRAPGQCVEGLVYLLTENDECQLDKSEGVSKGLYEKFHLSIEVCPASINDIGGRLVFDVAQQLKDQRPDRTHAESAALPENHLDQRFANRQQPSHSKSGVPRSLSAPGRQTLNKTIDTKSTQMDNSSFTSNQHRPRVEKATALVYRSLQFQEDGTIRDEYIGRMNAGIIDARKLGISDWYVGNCLRRYISEQQWPENKCSSAQKSHPDRRRYRPTTVRLFLTSLPLSPTFLEG